MKSNKVKAGMLKLAVACFLFVGGFTVVNAQATAPTSAGKILHAMDMGHIDVAPADRDDYTNTVNAGIEADKAAANLEAEIAADQEHTYQKFFLMFTAERNALIASGGSVVDIDQKINVLFQKWGKNPESIDPSTGAEIPSATE